MIDEAEDWGGERYRLISCEAPGSEHLTILWDLKTETVIDVLDAREAAAYALEGDIL